jgi:hypothetical protein
LSGFGSITTFGYWGDIDIASRPIARIYSQQLLNLKQKLLLKEKESLSFNELDFNISEDEILSAIKKFKGNKSGGLQLITNDILMAGKFQLTHKF